MDRDHGWVGACGDGGGVHFDRVREQRRAFKSGGDDRGRCANRKLRKSAALPRRANFGCDRWSDAGLDSLVAALARDGGSRGEVGLLLHGACDSELRAEPVERDHRDVCACLRGGSDFLEERGSGRTGSVGAVSGWVPCVGYRSFAWRDDRVRDQSGERLWTAWSACGVASGG